MTEPPQQHPGRLVTMDQLLLQPKVHKAWIVKSKALTFDLTPELVHGFVELWQSYQAVHWSNPAEFLHEHPLTEQDQLFALFCSAWFLSHQGYNLRIESNAPFLHWFMD